MDKQELQALNVFERYALLEKMGMLADEERIGQPERPFEEWSEDDFSHVNEVFETWPYLSQSDTGFNDVIARFRHSFNLQDYMDMDQQEILETAAEALQNALRDTYGADVPKIELVFERYPGRNGYYGGLRPDDKIQIDPDKFAIGSVEGSDFTGITSFVELVMHESTHLMQRYWADQSDGTTEDYRLSARASMDFYEAVDGARKVGHRELYWNHPLEVQARDFARELTHSALMYELGASAHHLGHDEDTFTFV